MAVPVGRTWHVLVQVQRCEHEGTSDSTGGDVQRPKSVRVTLGQSVPSRRNPLHALAGERTEYIDLIMRRDIPGSGEN